MVVCIPTSNNESIKSNIHSHFGSANYFCIYNTETDELEIIKNNNSHHEHGKCNPTDKIADKNVDVVISGGMGKRALAKLNKEGIRVFLSGSEIVEDAIKALNENKLEELNLENACGGHHGHH